MRSLVRMKIVRSDHEAISGGSASDPDSDAIGSTTSLRDAARARRGANGLTWVVTVIPMQGIERATLMVILLVAVGCSGGGDNDGGAASTSPPADPATTVATNATTNAESDAATTAAPTTTVPVADVPAGVNWQPAADAPTTPPLISYDLVAASAGRPAGPPGHPFEVASYISGEYSAAGATFVAAASVWNAGQSVATEPGARSLPFLFRSSDGISWTRIDLSALGEVDAEIDSVGDYGGGAIATVTVTDPTQTSPTSVVVLTSPDGLTWSRAAEIAGPASISGGEVFAVGNALVLAGFDEACSFDGAPVGLYTDPGTQMRLWTSPDGGITWNDISKSDGALDVKEPPPIDSSLCPASFGKGIRFGSTPRDIGVFGGRLVIWSADGARVASTADGTTWQQSTLPDGSTDSLGSALVEIDGGIVALSLQRARRADGSQTPTVEAFQVESWRSADGLSWELHPVGRPFVVDDASVSASGTFTVVADGSIHVAVSASLGARATPVSFASVSGPADDWRTCVLAAAAKCSFAERFAAVEPDTDLTGIDLRGAQIGAIDLTGADLGDADLRDAVLLETVITDATFANADLEGAMFNVDFVGVSLSDAGFNPYGITTDGRFFDAEGPPTASLIGMTIDVSTHPIPAGTSFGGVRMTGTTFQGVRALGNLTGIDFSGAEMSYVSFVNVDLTSATFTGTDLSTATFDMTTVCPDGLPSDPAPTGGAACRL